MGGASLFVIAMALPTPVKAQTANTTAADVNVLNLLSPFLGLNGTTTGQQTLTSNLNDALAVNKFASTSSTIEATSISDKTIASGNSTAITLASGATANYGPGANLGGGFPVQQVQSTGGIAPFQQYGGLGTLGTAYQAAVSPSGAAVPSVVTLLNNAYTFNSTDLGIAKNYFANGTINGTTTAVAPSGFTLPTADGYPNKTTSVYDTAYGVSNTGANQDIFGDSRPSQVASSSVVGYDPTALAGLASNPSFPSGHTTYGFTDSILIGMMAPQFYQSMLLRGSEFGNSRISLGVHYPLDIIASRSFVSYDLAQLLNASGSAYTQTNAVSGATAQNLNTQFQTAATAFNTYLNTQTGGCGGSLAACAASNPYNTYSATTYANAPFVTNAGSTTASENSAIYQSRLTYGLPTLSFTTAPREQAPTGGPDASILLATIYGGSTAAAQGLANSVGGALDGNLSTATINQIIVNTETNALAAFYGTSLSYWARLDLYDAAGYFQNVTGTINLAAGDQLKTNVTVGSTGVLAGNGTITGNVTVQSGGELGVTNNAGTVTELTVNGTTALQAGSKIALTGIFLPGKTYNVLTSTGTITVDPSVTVDTTSSTDLMTAVGGRIAVTGDPTLTVTPQSNFAGTVVAGTNAAAVAAATDFAGNAGGYGANGTTFLTNLITNNTAATATQAFNALSGEGIAGQQQAAFDAGDDFARTTLTQAIWSDDNADPNAQSRTMGLMRAWGSAFGGSDSLDGEARAGSTTLSSNVAGFQVGGDFQVQPGLRLGAAAGYSHSDYSNSARATSGDLDAGHIALYATARWSEAYFTGLLEYANYGSSERRSVFGSGEEGNFTGNEYLARGEAGYAVPVLDGLNTTPFAGFELATLQNDGFRESGSAAAIDGLDVNSRSVSSQKIFLGLQMDANQLFADMGEFTPYSRIAWEHEFDTKRAISASLQALPNANFTVLGAPAAADLARVDVGVKTKLTDTVSLFAEFDGGFADRGNFYGGRGGVKFTW